MHTEWWPDGIAFSEHEAPNSPFAREPGWFSKTFDSFCQDMALDVRHNILFGVLNSAASNVSSGYDTGSFLDSSIGSSVLFAA
jgi:hypothetical protein